MIQVLYVDDEQGFLNLGKHFLELSGEIRIETARSPEEALEKLRKQKYDTIISDYQMPEMDGLEFLKIVRSLFGKIPFIIFTGKGREEVVIQALNSGVDFYLQKGGEPFSQFAELEHKIKLADERNRTRNALSQSKWRMRGIVNHLPDATFAIDAEGRVIVWNRAMEDMTGIPELEIIGKGNREYALHFYGFRRPMLIDVALNKNLPIDKEYQSFSRKGDIVEGEVTTVIPSQQTNSPMMIWGLATPLYDTENNVAGAIESLRDISEQRRIQDSLIESEKVYRNVVEDQTEFIVRFRPDGTCVFVNDAYCRYFHLNRTDIIGTKFSPRLFPGDAAQIRRHLASLTPGHPVSLITHRIILPDGEMRWQRWSDRAIFNERGEVIEYQSVGRDDTEFHKHQEALERAKRKSDLLIRIVRHDILNQLTILNGFLDLSFKMIQDPDKLTNFIEKERKSVRNIENLLSLSGDYLSIGLDAPIWQEVNRKIREVLASYPLQNVCVDLDSRRVEILADALLTRIFFNLVHNAVIHGGEKLDRISISFLETDNGMKILWEDNGAGIPKEMKEHLFDKELGKRSVHGLFLIREILAVTGITITETGELGKGAKFELLVPKGKYRFL